MEAELEAVARAICAARGRDPDANDWVGSLAERRSFQLVPQWTRYLPEAQAAVGAVKGGEPAADAVCIPSADWGLIAGCAAALCEQMARNGEDVADIAGALERAGLSVALPDAGEGPAEAVETPPAEAIRAEGAPQGPRPSRLPAALPLNFFLGDTLDFAHA